MSNNPLDELEAARKEMMDAQIRWKSLQRKHEIAENQKLIGKSFRGHISDRHCDRYVRVRGVDSFGNLTGDAISFYGIDNIELQFNTIVNTDDIDIMDEISTGDYVKCLLGINAKIMEKLYCNVT